MRGNPRPTGNILPTRSRRKKEGYKAAAALFRAVAAADTIHAHSHLRIAGKVGDTRQNLKDAIEGETYEFESMYPEFIKIAQRKGTAKL